MTTTRARHRGAPARRCISTREPESIHQAERWERVKRQGVRFGLCIVCAAQVAWGAQLGFSQTTRQPCATCAPLMAALPVSQANGWQTPAGVLSRPWMSATDDAGTPPPHDAQAPVRSPGEVAA